MLVLAHLGLMKTGTTTIQSTLRRNAGVLKGRVAVATCDEPTAAVRRYGQRLVQKARRDAEAGLREALAGLRAGLERDGAPVAVISDETLYCRLVYSETGDLFDWTRRALPLVARAFEGHDLRFVFYVREPEAWTRSAWRQMVKRARCTLDFDAWRKGIPFEPAWRERFAEVQAVAGAPVDVLDMDSEAEDGRLGAGLLRLAGLDAADLDRIAWSEPRNVAMPSGAVEFMRSVNASNLPFKTVLAISDLVQASSHHFVQEPLRTAVDGGVTLNDPPLPPKALTHGSEDGISLVKIAPQARICRNENAGERDGRWSR